MTSCLKIFTAILMFFSSLLFCEYLSPPYEDYDCHSSSIVEAKPGIFCAVWKGGFGNGKCNVEMKEKVGIWITRFENDEWSQPIEIVEAPNSVCWSPVIALSPNDELLLFYRIGENPRQMAAFMKRSSDCGKTWTEAELLPAGILGPIRSKPLFDGDGNMICGSSVEVGSPEDTFKATACYVEILNSDGESWSKHGPIEIPEKKFGAIEPVLFYDRGNIKMLCRDRSHRIGGIGWIWSSTSYNGGKTWETLKRTELPNPDSGMDIVAINGRLLMAYNHSHDHRFPLNLALSSDGGSTWQPSLVLEEKSGEFPSICIGSDNLIHIVYAHKEEGKDQRRIKHVIIDPQEL